MKTKYTPGPWRVWPNKERTFTILGGKAGAGEDVIARVNGGFETSYRANAHLIASAPDLLEALVNCVDGLGCQPGYVNTLALSIAQQAIAKAKGGEL